METGPLLHFQFSVAGSHSITFRNPLKVFTTVHVTDVIHMLDQIQSEVDAGYYAAGYLSYESAPAFDSANKVKSDSQMPLLWFGIFERPEEDTRLVSDENYVVSKWEPHITKDTYRQKILEIKDEIKNGETYQVNYTLRMRANFEGDDVSFFNKISRAQNSKYSSYLNIGRFRILSVSPELFFSVNEGKLTTRPMKGTIERGHWIEQDVTQRERLRESIKDRAENVMIVDLIRNDLGRLAKTGTVEVPKLYEIEKLPTVYQMTSTVNCELMNDPPLKEIFSALFPCGSITGAPKINTMKIIEQLEDTPREVYCGAIGYLGPDKDCIFSVPIRTVWIDYDKGKAEYSVGGGVTWDSSPDGEYDEAISKAAVLTAESRSFNLLESLKLSYGEYFLLNYHLKRIIGSAEYFDFKYNEGRIRKQLDDIARQYDNGDYKVRLLLSKDGEISVQSEVIKPIIGKQKVTICNEPIDTESSFIYHKTTIRDHYEKHIDKSNEVFDSLLWNKKGELTEFTRGNLVIQLKGVKFTPPQCSGLLNGTFRQYLLESGCIKERILTRSVLKNAEKVWFINSVRKWVEVMF